MSMSIRGETAFGLRGSDDYRRKDVRANWPSKEEWGCNRGNRGRSVLGGEGGMVQETTESTGKIRKQPKCPSVDEWMKKLWYTYKVTYYLATRENILLFQQHG